MAGKAVDKSALADVSLADDSKSHDRLVNPVVFGLIGQDPDDFFAELACAPAMHGRDGQWQAKAQLAECPGVGVELGRVGFVGNQDNGPAAAAKQLGDLLVQTNQAVLNIDGKNNHGGFVQSKADLLSDVLGEVGDVLDAVAAGVDHLEGNPFMLNDGADAIAGDAGRGFDDADSTSGQAVEEAALANVWSTDNGYDWDGHVVILLGLGRNVPADHGSVV